jgi:hypothetical protein
MILNAICNQPVSETNVREIGDLASTVEREIAARGEPGLYPPE